ncbi:MAG: M56 family metallopeptidase [Bacteroidaceae bacterium]|nr:M56 family metallopeptidase [Bacteroidaceae bacterium]
MTILLYLIKWAIALSSLFVLYALTLRRETFHSLKRAVLLGVLVVSAVLPFVQLQVVSPLGALTRGARPVSLDNVFLSGGQSVEVVREAEPAVRASFDGGEVKGQGKNVQNVEVTGVQAKQPSEWIPFSLILLWGGGALVLLVLYARSLLATSWMIHRSRRVRLDGVSKDIYVLVSERIASPCSWMRWILLPEETLAQPQELRTVLLHEQAHVRLGHSWDMILAEVTARLLWFVPLAWMVRRELADVHEFEADQAVLQAGVAQTAYDAVLVAHAVGTQLQPVVNAFNQTQVKARLAMMYAKASSRRSRLKALWLLPLVGIVVMLFACYRAKPSPLVGTWMLYGVRYGEDAKVEEWHKDPAHLYRIFEADSTLWEVVTFADTEDTRTQAVGTWTQPRANRFMEHILYANRDLRGLRFPMDHSSRKRRYDARSFSLGEKGDTLYIYDQEHEVELWVRVPDGSVLRSEPDVQRTSIALAVTRVRQKDLPRQVREQPETAALYAMIDLIKKNRGPKDILSYKLTSVVRTGESVLVSTEMYDEHVYITMKQHEGQWIMDHFYPENVFVKELLRKCVNQNRTES